MTLETLYLFLAHATLTALGVWLNSKAGDRFIAWSSYAMVLVGVTGMVYLLGAALFGWPLLGGAA
ncbi:hypothetical protein [Nocardiopsis synnemataformans]|uniref:hypothetical protein n=1 Tax=Nocardiopsis synnemataformans TaxID=61305 RepID=UPI003EB7CFC7